MDEILDILACPACRKDLQERGDFLACRGCGLAFPVLDGKIPDLIREDAWSLDRAAKSGFRAREE